MSNQIRPHEEQSSLERTLRSLRWQPADRLERMNRDLPGHVRRKEYRAAADCQDAIRKAEAQIKMWDDLLALYEEERTAWLSAKAP